MNIEPDMCSDRLLKRQQTALHLLSVLTNLNGMGYKAKPDAEPCTGCTRVSKRFKTVLVNVSLLFQKQHRSV